MAGDHLQSLRRLAKRFNIRDRRQGEEWPEAHKKTFQNIKALGDYKFDTYIQGVSVLSDEEPWKQQTKARAQWLANRAERLFGSVTKQVGALGLRMTYCEGLPWKLLDVESIGLTSPSPRCRARVWQSEIQATWINDNDDNAQLEERRKQRRPCQCPPDERPKDFYEIGTNSLFDDRVDEFVIYDDLVKSHLPKQGPDRVFGLQNTRNFEKLLSSPVRPDIRKDPEDTIEDILRVTPFKSQADPLLFPFLVLEAKSENSPRGFDAILVQSSFPIRALLMMQEELRSHVPEGERVFDPLVWFLASRGDAWKVWCGHVTKGENEEPTKYETTLLWSGSLLHRDDALQLVLIVDYIMDWGRDIYRIAILRQLKSMVTGQPYDQISLVDSAMFSMRRDVSNWVPAPPSTVFNDLAELNDRVDDEDITPSKHLDHQALLDIPIPNTTLGSLRSAFRTNFRFSCFHLTESILPSFLKIYRSKYDSQAATKTTARHIISLLTENDGILVISRADLDLIEFLWTDTVMPADPDEGSEETYVVMEATWYFSTSWDIIRELSCLAVTKSAFEILKTHANFKLRHKGIDRLPKAERRCSRDVVRQCIDCLRSGSPWQNLLSAISCTLVALYPLPVRKRKDFTPPVDVLGLRYKSKSRVKSFITKHLKRELGKPRAKNSYVNGLLASINHNQIELERGLDALDRRLRKWEGSPLTRTNPQWKRISEHHSITSEEESHEHDTCGRCVLSFKTIISPFAHGFLDTRNAPVLSDYNTVLIVSLENNDRTKSKTDSCVFALGSMRELKDNGGLSLMIEDLLQSGLVYHTNKHAINEISRNFTYEHNLPLPYRSVSRKERFRLDNWIHELRNEPLSLYNEEDGSPSHGFRLGELGLTNKLLKLLGIGHPEDDANFLSKRSRLIADYGEVRYEPVEQFASWNDGKLFLLSKYPKQFSFMESFRDEMLSNRKT